ncbi:MAG TPA: metallopeptidase TldD-related protein [Terriglobales bacterium]|jgi:predicted Zn-dependent protease|nr:metallopeptidase TldD-related protein [Terriglobales bacterium]
MTRSIRALVVLSMLVAAGIGLPARAADVKSATGNDPVLRAMQAEMERSKSQLKLADTQPPYYVDYRLMDVDQYVAEAAFGAVRSTLRTRVRMLRIVVRVGDYKQDSYFGAGEGVVDVGPLDDDEAGLRHQLWLGTDRAYKAAAEALTAKQAELKKYTVDQPVDDFAHASAVQSISPLARLDSVPQSWLSTIEEASALYKSDPQMQSLNASVRFTVANRYFVNSEGSVVRSSDSFYQVYVGGYTQAADGMRLDRSHSYQVRRLKDLPEKEEVLSETRQLLASLKQLREAPVSEEDYRGPVLFSADAAAGVMSALVGPNVQGRRPMLGQNARTIGDWANNYRSRVLPDFISVVDDPTVASFQGHSLLGSYQVDDEGVKPSRVEVIEKGRLVNYLLGREPIRDFPDSNGHGRAAVTGPPMASLGNLIVQASEPLSNDELKKKLIEECRQRNLKFGYFVATLGPRLTPRLLYRVSTEDGHEELVRGGAFGDLDTRSLRNNIISAGKEMDSEDQLDPVPQSVLSPALLFDDLEVKWGDTTKQKLPDYPPPEASR